MARSRPARKPNTELKNTSYEIFIGILSVLSIANLILVFALQGDDALQQILSAMNGLFSIIFLGDFIYRMATAESAARYFFRGFGWADLLASLPLAQLKILRIFRLLRVYRLLREVGPRAIWSTLIRDRANSALMTLLLMGVLVLQFGSLAMLWIEEDADGANITSASDALWYTVVTISTVGYGDQFPVTNLGRVLGAVIIIVGVGIFGTFTGYLANLFLGPGKAADSGGESADAGESASSETMAPTAEHTAKGMAAGASSGAVTAGASAGAATSTADAPPSIETAASDDEPTDARLRALLAQSELISAELRSLVGAGGSGQL
jgi:voltage-gated potassium channel